MYAHILVPIDGGPTSQHGFNEALRLARALGATVHLLHVVDARLLISELALSTPPDQLLDDWRDAGEKLVAESVEKARAAGVNADGAVRCDPGMRVCDLIVEQARTTGAELIVMGTHGRRGLRRFALGSDAELVLRDAPVPVLLVRNGES